MPVSVFRHDLRYEKTGAGSRVTGPQPSATAEQAGGQARPDFSGRWTSVVAPQPATEGGGAAPVVAGDMGSGWGTTIALAQTALVLTVPYARQRLRLGRHPSGLAPYIIRPIRSTVRSESCAPLPWVASVRCIVVVGSRDSVLLTTPVQLRP